MFDPHDTCNVCMTGQGVREDHSDPVRAIQLTKWLVKASYIDENEEISLVRKKRIFGRSSRSEFDPDRQILPDSIFPTFKLLDFIIFRIRFGYGFSDLETGLPLRNTQIKPHSGPTSDGDQVAGLQ